LWIVWPTFLRTRYDEFVWHVGHPHPCRREHPFLMTHDVSACQRGRGEQLPWGDAEGNVGNMTRFRYSSEEYCLTSREQ
jgi:hypothetical protein